MTVYIRGWISPFQGDGIHTILRFFMTLSRTRLIQYSLLFVIGLCFIFLFCEDSTEAKIITVDDDGDADYEKLQFAIDNATEGDTIRVYEGVYREVILVNKTLSLIGNGSETTTIKAPGDTDAVRIEANWCSISGFAIQAAPNASSCIVVNSDHNRIQDNNCSSSSSGIVLNQTEDIVLSGNYLGEGQVGILLKGARNTTITGNSITSNDYGLLVENQSKNTLVYSNHIFNNNEYGIHATDNGGHVVNAARNWWGHGTGPHHPVNSSEGLGDNITDNVDFWPWYATLTTTAEREFVEVGYNPVRVISDTIQGAVNLANDGDTVVVSPGNYSEKVVVNRSIELKGAGSLTTIVDGGGSGNVVEVDSSGVRLTGFTFRNGELGLVLTGQNCSVSDLNCSDNERGVWVNRAANVTLSRTLTSCSNSSLGYYGVSVENSINITLERVTHFGRGSGNGLYLNNSMYCLVKNSTFSRSYRGILAISGDHNLISGNTLSDNRASGIRLSFCGNITIANNSLENNSALLYFLREYADISIHESPFVVLRDNRMNRSGISFHGYSEDLLNFDIDMDSSNTIRGRPVYYYNGVSGITVPTDAAQVFIINCRDMRVNDLDLGGGVWCGLFIRNSSGIIVENNSFTDGYYGIFAIWSRSVEIRNNTFSDNGYGVLLSASDNLIVDNNICSNNIGHGISVNGWHSEATNITISKNTCRDNGGDIRPGIDLSLVNNSIVENNTCTNNGYGIMLSRAIGTRLLSNIILGNERYGVRVKNSSGMELHNNFISGNTLGGIYASRTVNATNNWWGHNTGPYHLENNTSGQGDNVSDNVIFDPWYSGPRAEILDISPGRVNEEENVSFLGGGSSWTGITRYTWSSSRDGELYNGSSTSFETGNLSNGTHTISLKLRDGNGIWGVEVQTTLRVNGLPRPLSLTPLSTMVLRTNTVKLRARCNDDENSWKLTPSFQYRGPDTIWVDDWISDVIYDSSRGRWETRFTPPVDAKPGSYDLRVKFKDMDDGESQWLFSGKQVEVRNNRPVAVMDSILPQPALDTEELVFQGHGVDVEAGVNYYLWKTTGKELYRGPDGSFGYTGLASGSHTISFCVLDSDDIWSEEVTSTILVHQRPESFIDGVSPNPTLVGKRIQFSGSGEDDGSVELYAWNSSLEGELHRDGNPDFTTTLIPGTHTISLKVQDNHGIWSEEKQTIVVVHTRPLAAISFISPEAAVEGEEIRFTATGVDDGSTITGYAWSSSIGGEFYNGTEQIISYSELSPGLHIISLKVRDNYEAWSWAAMTSLEIWVVPSAEIIPLESISVREGKTVHFSALGTANGSIVCYVWSSSIDGEFYNDSDAEFDYDGLSQGVHSITLVVQDEHGSWSRNATTNLTVLEDDDDAGGTAVCFALSFVLFTILAGALYFRMRNRDEETVEQSKGQKDEEIKETPTDDATKDQREEEMCREWGPKLAAEDPGGEDEAGASAKEEDPGEPGPEEGKASPKGETGAQGEEHESEVPEDEDPGTGEEERSPKPAKL